jgi:hypothetical protein
MASVSTVREGKGCVAPACGVTSSATRVNQADVREWRMTLQAGVSRSDSGIAGTV